jgi:hypothetical protein
MKGAIEVGKAKRVGITHFPFSEEPRESREHSNRRIAFWRKVRIKKRPSFISRGNSGFT